jgi:hypothetical protein
MTANVTNLPVAQPDPSEIMEAVLLAGDLSKLTAEERTSYYMKVCQSVGLNPYTKPFDYIRLSGREVLYAKKDCADQLRSNRRISLEITDRKVTGDLMVVTVRATTPDGRFDEDMGAVSIKGLAGEALANAAMKAITKAKRRATLSVCGLGMLDETEVRSALEAERESGPPRVSAPPPRLELEAPKPASPPAKPPLLVVLGGGWEPAQFPRGKKGLREAMEFMTGAVVDGKPEIVGLNVALLDQVAEHLPDLAEEVANLRAAAAEALAATDDAELRDDSTDDFPGDIPPAPGSSLPPS